MKKIIAIALLALASAPVFAANQATIKFNAPTKYEDGSTIATGTTITYNLYQGLKGAAKTKVGTVVSGSTVTTGLQSGSDYCWQVTAVINGMESDKSNEACKAFPFPTPQAVTITVE